MNMDNFYTWEKMQEKIASPFPIDEEE